MFEDLGWRRIDCDALVRTEVLTDPCIITLIQKQFGAGVIVDGAIDRARLADRVFTDSVSLKWLEALVHPEVHKRWVARVEEAPEANWVVEVPLLFEKGLQKGFDFVACVACSPSVQLARLQERGMNRTLAEQRISQQHPLVSKLEHSHFVLSNDGTPEFLRRQIELLTARLITNASQGLI
jgi:dephospho-CoA kinase